jgi:DnaK suppressor protein
MPLKEKKLNLKDQKQQLEKILNDRPNTGNIREEIRQHDSGDMASDLGNLATETIRLDKQRMKKVRARVALSKIADGTYNKCTACDDNISERRLIAVPEAIFCVRCQDLQDKRERGEIADFEVDVEALLANPA